MKMPIPKVREEGRAERILEKVFSDITGPEDVQTPAGELYALNFIDDCSDKMWGYPLKNKSDATAKFKEWKAIIEKETRLEVKAYRTDNGGEFTSNNFEQYPREVGVKHEVTPPYSPAQNGKSERAH
jgi:transposase InsO family protein